MSTQKIEVRKDTKKYKKSQMKVRINVRIIYSFSSKKYKFSCKYARKFERNHRPVRPTQKYVNFTDHYEIIYEHLTHSVVTQRTFSGDSSKSSPNICCSTRPARISISTHFGEGPPHSKKTSKVKAIRAALVRLGYPDCHGVQRVRNYDCGTVPGIASIKTCLK